MSKMRTTANLSTCATFSLEPISKTLSKPHPKFTTRHSAQSNCLHWRRAVLPQVVGQLALLLIASWAGILREWRWTDTKETQIYGSGWGYQDVMALCCVYDYLGQKVFVQKRYTMRELSWFGQERLLATLELDLLYLFNHSNFSFCLISLSVVMEDLIPQSASIILLCCFLLEGCCLNVIFQQVYYSFESICSTTKPAA